jgi:hypothetical protein
VRCDASDLGWRRRKEGDNEETGDKASPWRDTSNWGGEGERRVTTKRLVTEHSHDTCDVIVGASIIKVVEKGRGGRGSHQRIR